MLAALERDIDAWRAIEVAGHLPQAAAELVPRLRDHLRRSDLTKQRTEMSVRALLAASAALGGPAATPVVVDTLTAAVRHEQHHVTRAALNAPQAFGPAASSARDTIGSLTTASDPRVRTAALAALCAADEDPAEVVPALQAMAQSPATANHVVACLERMGHLATPALPLLREQLAGPRHGGRFQSIDNDEALQHIGRALIARLKYFRPR